MDKVTTIEQLVEILEESEYVKYDRPLFEGLTILSKYVTDDPLQAAEHDKVYGPDGDDLIAAGITCEDAEKLGAMAWGYDADSNCIRRFL